MLSLCVNFVGCFVASNIAGSQYRLLHVQSAIGTCIKIVETKNIKENRGIIEGDFNALAQKRF